MAHYCQRICHKIKQKSSLQGFTFRRPTRKMAPQRSRHFMSALARSMLPGPCCKKPNGHFQLKCPIRIGTKPKNQSCSTDLLNIFFKTTGVYANHSSVKMDISEPFHVKLSPEYNLKNINFFSFIRYVTLTLLN